jgi:hypothetical protein
MRIVLSLVAAFTVNASAFAQEPCTSSAPRTVDDVYQHVLQRPADPGSAELSRRLASGALTVRDVVSILAHSSEYAARFFWPPVVSEGYRQILERQPTSDEMRVSATALALGELTPETLIADLATRAANNEPDSIRIVYTRLLGREPDADGLRVYRQLAEREGLAGVTRSIVASSEYRARAAASQRGMGAYVQSVGTLYRHLLDRQPDPDGLRALAELAMVYGPRGPIDRMLNSAEYRDRFGANGIPGRDGMTFCQVTPPPRTAVPRR